MIYINILSKTGHMQTFTATQGFTGIMSLPDIGCESDSAQHVFYHSTTGGIMVISGHGRKWANREFMYCTVYVSPYHLVTVPG